MRPELKNLDYYVYGVSEGDFDYYRRLFEGVIESHLQATRQQIEALGPDADVEVISDVAYYGHLETVFLWEHALWRFQGILEALITTVFLPGPATEGLLGLAAKLKAMRKAGYQLSDADEEELLAWAKLRNALSHRPPEQYRPVWLQEEDVDEYLALVRRLCAQWRSGQTSPVEP